jgi:hypothetical protein
LYDSIFSIADDVMNVAPLAAAEFMHIPLYLREKFSEV